MSVLSRVELSVFPNCAVRATLSRLNRSDDCHQHYPLSNRVAQKQSPQFNPHDSHSQPLSHRTLSLFPAYHTSVWLPLLLIYVLCLTTTYLPCAQAGCRSSTGVSMCCCGRQSNCSSYTLDNQFSNAHRMQRYIRTVPQKRCFCDQHCKMTNDCCPDYAEVCEKAETDCLVSVWGPWSRCNPQCGLGNSVRRRRVLVPASQCGKPCPVLEETRQCQGTKCTSLRVVRSGATRIPYMNQIGGEVAQLLPVRGDVMQMLRQHDMRWDVRRKLYLGRLIQQNRTEQPEPEPYCSIYEITHANPACQMHNILWHFSSDPVPDNYGDIHPYGKTNQYVPYSTNPYPHYHRRRRRSWGSWNNGPGPQSKRLMSDWGMTNTWSHVWMTHAALLTPGQQICITCYPAYIRCPAIGYPGLESRWRALRTADCQGTFRLVSMPRKMCTCGQGVASFVFV